MLAGVALAFGGVLVAVAPAHAADFPDVNTELELNAAIDYAELNPSDVANVTITGNIALFTGLNPLTLGHLVINGGFASISAVSVPSAGFKVSGTAELEINDLEFNFDDSGPLVFADGEPADPAASPTVTLSRFAGTSGPYDTALDIADATFSASDVSLFGSMSGILGTFSFGDVTLSDVAVVDSAVCGIDIALTADATLVADELVIERASCTALSVSATDTASATITHSVLADNGGGVFFGNFGTGTIELRDSTISGSTAEEQVTGFGFGGDIRVTSSTITGGLATSYPAVSAFIGDGSFIFEHSTVTDNAVSGAPAFAVVDVCGCGALGAFVLDHTIVAGNVGAGLGAPDLLIEPGVPTVIDWSLIEYVDPADTTTLDAIAAGSGNLFDPSVPIAPDLGALAMNGGVTPTHLPNGTSPVINAGDVGFAPPPATDQRGSARISGGIIDIGAVEVQFNPTLILSRTMIAVGDQVTVTGTGLPADTTFTMVFNSTPVTLGTATSNASGGLAFAFTVPTSVPAGAHTVTATLAGNVVGSAAITVTGLPDTGSDTTSTTLFAALLLLVGTSALLLRRRRA